MSLFNFRSKKADEAAPAPEAKQPGFIARLRAKLNRGDSWLTYDLANLLPGGKIDDAVLDELETRLIGADVGIETTERRSSLTCAARWSARSSATSTHCSARCASRCSTSSVR